MTIDSTVNGLIDLIADRVADRVVAKLGRSGDATSYTTAKQGPHIPGKSRDWMRRHVRTMPGSRKIGLHWVISKADFDAWASAQDASRRRPRSPSVAMTMDDADYAEAMLAKVGLRVRRTG